MIYAVTFVALLVGIPLGLMFCTVVARDMDSRGLDGRIYGALTLFVFPVGLGLWLYKRSTRPRLNDDKVA